MDDRDSVGQYNPKNNTLAELTVGLEYQRKFIEVLAEALEKIKGDVDQQKLTNERLNGTIKQLESEINRIKSDQIDNKTLFEIKSELLQLCNDLESQKVHTKSIDDIIDKLSHLNSDNELVRVFLAADNIQLINELIKNSKKQSIFKSSLTLALIPATVAGIISIALHFLDK